MNLVIIVYPDRKVMRKVSRMSSIRKKPFDFFCFNRCAYHLLKYYPYTFFSLTIGSEKVFQG